ncbi:hypothetical protein DFH06DRAFT_712207 [Mycena polygramma]|nr:hypothetical protein DFH06DRAFT_712207 [Mycena polygramma]
MLKRGLRENRHPRYAAEVRENLVPVRRDLHMRSNEGTPSLTLFPHEDVLAKALEYELALAALRQAEVDAGRADPGRPSYEAAYGVSGIVDSPLCCFLNEFVKNLPVPCRAHMSPNIDHTGGLCRFESASGPPVYYHPSQCPGVGVSDTPFPVIETLLSLPFALLHQYPRLNAITPASHYQQQVLDLALAIITLWDFDPGTPSPAEASNDAIFQQLEPVNTRVATFTSILPRIGEALTFHCRTPSPSNADDAWSDSDGLGESGGNGSDEGKYSSSSSGGVIGKDNERFIGATANDTLMACGYLSPRDWLRYRRIPAASE